MSTGTDLVQIEMFTLGPWQTNCYVVTAQSESRASESENSHTCWIIDAGFEPEEMIAAVQQRGLKPERLILTHAHIDHIAGVTQMRAAFGDSMKVMIHEVEANFLNDPNLNLGSMAMMDICVGEADELLDDGDELTLGDSTWKVMYTPGHSPGGITLYEANASIALVGDTLFAGSIGRYDFPTSNGPLLFRAIRERLFTLPDDTKVYPGHGPATTIGQEKRTNPFVGENAPDMLMGG